ncbi:hypothetical protein VM636_03370 [Streptomyces sp. SCSIO 75703]|uniref:hypothetical protein n=1 Tax=Streptomyces sp. SCSIO 75703 TaxID=3112165 RepID=UPI0030CC28C2
MWCWTTSPRTGTPRSAPGRAATTSSWSSCRPYGSWLNWIEAEFADLRYFALNATDHRSHDEQNAALAAYIRWRNTRTEPKTAFASDSPIRAWIDYPTKAA